MLPGEGHEWQDGDGEALFTEPPKKKGKIIYVRLELKPPDFEFPGVGSGSHSKRCLLEFRLKAVKYAQSVVDGGRALEALLLALVTQPGRLIFPKRQRWHRGSKSGRRGEGGEPGDGCLLYTSDAADE